MSPNIDDAPDVRPADDTTPALERSGDRRALLKVAAAALAGVLAPAVARAQGVGPRPSPRKTVGTSGTPNVPWRTPLPVASPSISNADVPELRLVRRITMGITDAESARARQMGYDTYLEYHLAAETIDDSQVEAFVATNYPMVSQAVDQLYNADSGTIQAQLTNAWIYRAAFSTRQLRERAVEFWSDHFNIAISKVGYLKVGDDRDVIRKYALDTFPNLLKASAHSAAMLAYLDQTQSRNGAPNQNYAREIMELHTLGVNGGYTQTDVAELSRVLTGWTIAGRGNFNFDPNLHDFASKSVLGVTIPATVKSVVGAGAQGEGEQMLNVLVNHPSTAVFVGTKMLRYFLRYDPTPDQVAEVAGVYNGTGGDIKAMLRVVLSQKNLAAAPPKLKRPFHLVASTLRALGPGALVTKLDSLSRQVTTLGQQPFEWQTPDGYPDRIDYWAGNVLSRWNFASAASNANGADFKVDVTPFTANTAEGVVNAIGTYAYAGEMDPILRNELKSFLGTTQPTAAKIREALGLALSSSTFQYF